MNLFSDFNKKSKISIHISYYYIVSIEPTARNKQVEYVRSMLCYCFHTVNICCNVSPISEYSWFSADRKYFALNMICISRNIYKNAVRILVASASWARSLRVPYQFQDYRWTGSTIYKSWQTFINCFELLCVFNLYASCILYEKDYKYKYVRVF